MPCKLLIRLNQSIYFRYVPENAKLGTYGRLYVSENAESGT